MATCKDCIHYDICIFHLKGDENKKCIRFKNKADLVKVVRCRNCKYYKNDEFETRCDHPQLDFCVECYDHWLETKPNDFCSYGERRETNAE